MKEIADHALAGCEKVGTVPSADSTIADLQGFGEAQSGLSPIFSQPLTGRALNFNSKWFIPEMASLVPAQQFSELVVLRVGVA